MEYIIGILVLLLSISVWFGYVQFKARIMHQAVLNQMLIKMHKALLILRGVDKTGAFQSHDVVGQSFMLIVTAIQELRNYFVGQLGNGQKTQ